VLQLWGYFFFVYVFVAKAYSLGAQSLEETDAYLLSLLQKLTAWVHSHWKRLVRIELKHRVHSHWKRLMRIELKHGVHSHWKRLMRIVIKRVYLAAKLART